MSEAIIDDTVAKQRHACLLTIILKKKKFISLRHCVRATETDPKQQKSFYLHAKHDAHMDNYKHVIGTYIYLQKGFYTATGVR